MSSHLSLEHRALRYLAQREHSRLELTQKLSRYIADAQSNQLTALLDKLEQKGFISHERVTDQVIRSRRTRYGSKRIIFELKAKGIDGDLIRQAVTALDNTELDAAIKVWKKKFDCPPVTPEERNRQVRFLLNRGFSSETAQQVLKQTTDISE